MQEFWWANPINPALRRADKRVKPKHKYLWRVGEVKAVVTAWAMGSRPPNSFSCCYGNCEWKTANRREWSSVLCSVVTNMIQAHFVYQSVGEKKNQTRSASEFIFFWCADNSNATVIMYIHTNIHTHACMTTNMFACKYINKPTWVQLLSYASALTAHYLL